MRCHEARRRIEKAEGIISESLLMEHIADCPKCAALAEASGLIRRDLHLISRTDPDDMLPFEVLKSRVESRLSRQTPQDHKEISLMEKITRQLRLRPRLSLSLGVVAVILVLLTVIPLRLDRNGGYEVAIAGVDKNLALDNQRVSDLLAALGLDGVNFNVGDCEATCHLTISDLKSEKDVQMVVTAFNEMGHCTLEEIKFIASGDTTIGAEGESCQIYLWSNADDSTEVHEIVMQKLSVLKTDSTSTFTVWVSDEGNHETVSDVKIKLVDDLDPQNVGQIIMERVAADGSKMLRLDKTGGTMNLVYTDPDGVEHQLDINDPDIENKLKDLGLDFKIISNMGNGDSGMFISGIHTTTGGEGEAGQVEVVKEISALPEGFDLGQNYPNPFNPSTQIDYSLPTAQPVRLDIYNINGQKVRTLVDGYSEAGNHTVTWDATDDDGAWVASGVYLYKLTAGDKSVSRKMTLVK